MGGVRVVAASKLIPISGECGCPEIIRKISLRRRLGYQHTVSRHGALLKSPRIKYTFTVFSRFLFFDHLKQYLTRRQETVHQLLILLEATIRRSDNGLIDQ